MYPLDFMDYTLTDNQKRKKLYTSTPASLNNL